MRAPLPASLPRALTRALDEACTLRRGGAPEGREVLLSARERARFTALFAALPLPAQARLTELLQGPRGPAAEVERALLLKAALARLPALSRSEDPWRVLATFAQAIAGQREERLLAQSTVLDLDSRHNSHHLDPNRVFVRRGVLAEPGRSDHAGDNDGLFQRFTAACGPTVLEMMLGQIDPVFAWLLHQDAITSQSTEDQAARLQRELLERYGGIALELPAAQRRAIFRNRLGRLVGQGDVGEADARALRAHVERGRALTRGAERALAALRAAYQGAPDEDELHALGRRLPERDEGIDTEAMTRALAELISPATGIYYQPTHPPWGFARGQAWRHLDKVVQALGRGVDVPFGVAEPGHWMLATAARGRKPRREILVSDPAGGRTAWVGEQDFLRGAFVREPFGLCTGRERGYIDLFFLPRAR